MPAVLSDRLFQRVTTAVKRNERAYRNTRDHRRRNVTRGSSTNIAIATLTQVLNAGGNATATYLIGGTGSVNDGVYDTLLCEGDSLATGTKVVIASISGKWYVIDAVCPCGS